MQIWTPKNNKKQGECAETMSLSGVWRAIVEDIHTGEKRVKYYKNLLPTDGREMLANNLTSSSPNHEPHATHIALGDDGTSPSNSNTQLNNEVYRNQVASGTNSANVAYISGFFNATETSGTFKEAGIFSDGSGSTNSGVLVSHVTMNVTKSNTETLTLDWQITIS